MKIYSEHPKRISNKEEILELKVHVKLLENTVSSFDSRLLSLTQVIKTQNDYIDTRTPSASSLESVLKDFLHRINSIESTLSNLSHRISTFEIRLYNLEEHGVPQMNSTLENSVTAILNEYSTSYTKREEDFQREIRNTLRSKSSRPNNTKNLSAGKEDYIQEKISELEEKLKMQVITTERRLKTQNSTAKSSKTPRSSSNNPKQLSQLKMTHSNK